MSERESLFQDVARKRRFAFPFLRRQRGVTKLSVVAAERDHYRREVERCHEDLEDYRKSHRASRESMSEALVRVKAMEEAIDAAMQHIGQAVAIPAHNRNVLESILLRFNHLARPTPDALQDVLTREGKSREVAPEQPGAATSTDARGGHRNPRGDDILHRGGCNVLVGPCPCPRRDGSPRT